jgi:hypothetical protein
MSVAKERQEEWEEGHTDTTPVRSTPA